MAGPTKVNGDYDFQGNSIVAVIIEPVAAFPGAPQNGRLVYRTDLGKYYVYDDNSASWRDVTQQLVDFTTANALSIVIAGQVTQNSENTDAQYGVKRFNGAESREDAFLKWNETLKLWQIGYGANVYTAPRKLVHTQAVASANWSFSHNLGTKDVVVAVYDATDEMVIATVKTPDANTVTVDFAAPQTGRIVVVG